MPDKKQFTQALPAGTRLQSPQGTYTLLSVLGQGGFGITYKASTTLNIGNIRSKAIVTVKEHFVAAHSRRNGATLAVEAVDTPTGR